MSYRLSAQAARIPLGECPICAEKLNGASTISEPGIFAQPQPGDFTACIHCGGWLKFGPKLDLLRLSEWDILAMSNEEHDALRAVTKAVRQVEAQRSKVR
jgi:hypothetical protein